MIEKYIDEDWGESAIRGGDCFQALADQWMRIGEPVDCEMTPDTCLESLR